VEGAARHPQLRILLVAACSPHHDAFVAQFKDMLLTAVTDYLFDIDYRASPANPPPVVLYSNLRCRAQDVQPELLHCRPHIVHLYAPLTRAGVVGLDGSHDLAAELVREIARDEECDTKCVLLIGGKTRTIAQQLCQLDPQPPGNVPAPLIDYVVYTTDPVHYRVCQVWSAAWYASVFRGHRVGRAAAAADRQVFLDLQVHEGRDTAIRQMGDEELVLMPPLAGAAADAVAIRPPRHRPDYFNVPRRDVAHVQRPRVWQRLREALQELGRRRFVVLTGMGGVGKSQLALHYVANLPPGMDRYRFVAWFAAEDPDQLPTQYLDFAEQFMPPGTELHGRSDRAVVAMVTRWLTRQEHWLLVYDNAPSFHAIRDYLPELFDDFVTQHVLVTSRHQGWPIETCNPVELGVMQPEECLALVKTFGGFDRADQRHDADILSLAERLGGLPLALSQAAVYIASGAVSVTEYAETCELRLMQRGTASLPPGDPHVIVACTWDRIIDAVRSDLENRQPPLPPLGRIVLTACAYLAPDAIPRALLERWLQLAYPDLPEDVDVCSIVLSVLRDYSLIHYTDEGKQFLAVHRVLATVVRHQHETLDQTRLRDVWYPMPGLEWIAVVVRALNWEYAKEWSSAVHQDVYRKRLRPHMEHMADRHGTLNEQIADPLLLEAFAALWSNLGQLLDHMGRVQPARHALQQALGIYRRRGLDEDIKIADTLQCLANVEGQLGDYEEQRRLLEQVLAIKRRHYGGDEHPSVAATLYALAAVHGTMGEHAEQRRLLEQALAIYRHHDGSDEHINVAATLHALADVHGTLGEYAEQRRVLLQVLAVHRRYYRGDEDIGMAMMLHAIAGAHGTMGEHAEQRRLLEQVLAIQRRHYGDDEHVSVAVTFESLANMHGNMGEHVEQRRLLEQVLTIKRRHYGGDENMEVAATLQNIAQCDGAFGDYETRQRLLQQVLIIQRRHYRDDEHIEVANTIQQLGHALYALGELNQARELLEQSLAIQRRLYANGDDHLKVAHTLHRLAVVRGLQSDHVVERRLLEQALPVLQRHYGAEHIEVARPLHALAQAHGALGNHQLQRQLLEQALAIKRRHYGRDDVADVAITQHRLGDACGALGQHERQRELLLQALPVLRAHYGSDDHVKVASALNSLAAVSARETTTT
jgi:tetratricopeptide (TPR) repeat protein